MMAEFKPIEQIIRIESNRKSDGWNVSLVKELVRCKDCKYRTVNPKWKNGSNRLKAVCENDTGDPFELGRNAWDDDWFCADAERKESNV